MRPILIFLGLMLFSVSRCATEKAEPKVITGAERMSEYLPLIQDKTVALVANQTSMVGATHLVDTLRSLGVSIKVIFAPEHGFRDLADDGQTIQSGTEPLTGINIVSLYTSKRKPGPEDLQGVDYVIFDIQDVGTRFYTYLTTMSYVMEACAENKIPMIILDRPNPNGYYFDGTILDMAFSSFVGIHPIPVVHGMTFGEYSSMVNGEGWLANGVKCDVTVVRCLNYSHDTLYQLPIKPSPNLPNMNSVYLYPSVCFSEGTILSCGRGTPFAFQVLGAPKMPDNGFSFIPEPMPGATKPRHNGLVCYGLDLRNATVDGIVPAPGINLEWIIKAYNDYPEKDKFFNSYFDILAGGPSLREQIMQGKSPEEIKASWKEGLAEFGKIRAKYLMYN
ncbi:MAG TPA: DUF1343 domain-containing protein [Bacteroidales bacterium]|nr:DUF1343 domain-containing protein [Bacteroidales bacterium]